jgi:ParB family chromosome partitioning protein
MSARKGGLGRGLDSLIPSGSTGVPKPFDVIPVEEIQPNPQQPRARFDDETIDRLAESIAEVGILQPIAVTAGDDGYILIAGERRLRAARRAGLTEVPAVIRQVDDVGSLTEALVENLQREDLTPLEEAAAYQQLLEEFGMTHEDVAHRVGRSRSAVSNTIRLLQLPASIQGMLERREITAGHARPLVGLEDRAYAEHVARRAADEGWSVRQVEEAVRVREDMGEPPAPKVKEVRPVEIIELEQRLTEQLDARVKISYRKGKGTVRVAFSSLDDLERIYRTFFA